MNAQNRWTFAGRLAMTGAESGVLVTMVGVVPVLFLGRFLIEDAAAVAMLIAYGLVFGHFLARRLARAGLAVRDGRRLLLAAPPVAMVAGYAAMRLAMGMSQAPILSAADGILFGAVAGLLIGIAVLRLPLADTQNLPGPAAFAIPASFLVAGAVMGVVAGAVLSIPLAWMAAMPVWQAGIGAVMGRFLALPPQDA